MPAGMFTSSVRLPCASRETQALLAACVGGVQIDRDSGAHVASAHRPALRACAGSRTRAATEQGFKEIAEGPDVLVAHVAEVESAAAVLLRPIRRRAELVAAAITTRAQLVVGRAFLLVAQHLVGFVDRLEFLLGAGFLVLVRVIFARELAIGRLDFGLARGGLHSEYFVVILEFHQTDF